MEQNDRKNLKRRYLIWLYKTTKEVVDKIERKFTQLEVDRFILKELKKIDAHKKLDKFIKDWESYIRQKEKAGTALKYAGGHLNPDYQFLILKLKATEKAITKELGKQALFEIKQLYEKEMTERILKSTKH